MKRVLLLVLIGVFLAGPIRAAGQENRIKPSIRDLAWSPDGDHIARVFSNGTVEADNISTGGVEFEVSNKFALQWACIAWNPTNSNILAAGIERYVYIWDVSREVPLLFTLLAGAPDGTITTEYGGAETEVISALDWSPDGNMLASLSLGGILRTWDATTGQRMLDINQDQMFALTWNADGTQLLTGIGLAMRTIDSATGEFGFLNREHWMGGTISSVDLSPDGSELVSVNNVGQMAVWATSNGDSNTIITSNVKSTCTKKECASR